jgi:hypothetical protein
MNGFLVSFALSAERHLVAIDDEQEVKRIDERTFTNVVGTYELQGVAIVEAEFGFTVNF